MSLRPSLKRYWIRENTNSLFIRYYMMVDHAGLASDMIGHISTVLVNRKLILDSRTSRVV